MSELLEQLLTDSDLRNQEAAQLIAVDSVDAYAPWFE